MLTDDELLKLVRDEREQSIGFDDGDELSKEREANLEYYRGLTPDLPSLPNRSKAVSTETRDAVKTAMPDLVEIFIGGDDVASFNAMNAADEEQARIETEAVTNVIVEQNNGFLLFSTAFEDALITKLGVFRVWGEEKEETVGQERHEIPAGWAALAKPFGEMNGAAIEVEDHPENPEMKVAVATFKRQTKCIKVKAWPSEDFAFARDTVDLKEGPYCVLRARPRLQDLIDQGIERELAEEIQEYHETTSGGVAQARDSVNESDEAATFGRNDLRKVEVCEHFIRYDVKGTGKTQLWRVLTANDEGLLLDKEEIDVLPVACITPYLIPHRLIGMALADLTAEIQRIGTALLRLMLDSGYFALNQRFEVAEGQGRANEWTLSDLLSNIPGSPVRSDDGQSVRPLGSAGLGFDVAGALEYISTLSEKRTGIVRNAQGLNPDTLHETADGMRRMIGEAQKRIRLIARTFAETGVKDLFVIVRDMMRKHATEMDGYAIGRAGPIQPQNWLPRRNIRVEIGVGAGGREHDLAAGNQLIGMMKMAGEAQGGMDGPLVGPEQLHAALKRQTERLGYKNADQYWKDPKAQAGQPPGPPKPDPETIKAQAQSATDVQTATIKAGAETQSAQIKAQTDAQTAQLKAANDLRIAELKVAAEERIALRRLEMEDAFRRDQAADELDLKREEMAAEERLKLAEIMAEGNGGGPLGDVSTVIDGPTLGGGAG